MGAPCCVEAAGSGLRRLPAAQHRLHNRLREAGPLSSSPFQKARAPAFLPPWRPSDHQRRLAAQIKLWGHERRPGEEGACSCEPPHMPLAQWRAQRPACAPLDAKTCGILSLHRPQGPLAPAALPPPRFPPPRVGPARPLCFCAPPLACLPPCFAKSRHASPPARVGPVLLHPCCCPLAQ